MGIYIDIIIMMLIFIFIQFLDLVVFIKKCKFLIRITKLSIIYEFILVVVCLSIYFLDVNVSESVLEFLKILSKIPLIQLLPSIYYSIYGKFLGINKE